MASLFSSIIIFALFHIKHVDSIGKAYSFMDIALHRKPSLDPSTIDLPHLMTPSH